MKAGVLVAILTITVSPALGAVAPGDYIFVYAQILGCGDTIYIVDYGEVPESGRVGFVAGIEVSVLGLSEEEIATKIAEGIGTSTGRTPDSISVEFVTYDDPERIARELKRLSFGPLECLRRKERDLLPPGEDYVRSLANAPPNKVLHWPTGAVTPVALFWQRSRQRAVASKLER